MTLDESITGKLTTQTDAERAATLELARGIVDAEQNDEAGPFDDVFSRMRERADECDRGGMHNAARAERERADRVDLSLFRLAQALVAATDERDHAERGIAAFIAKHAEHLDPRVESSARKFLLELARDIDASRWPRAPKELA